MKRRQGRTAGLPLRALADPATWRPDPAAVAIRRALRSVPGGASVAASNRLAPQLTGRYPDVTVRPDWVAVPIPPDTALAGAGRMAGAMAGLPSLGYREVSSAGGVVLFARVP